MTIKESFLAEEDRLFDYMKSRIKDSFQKYCQWKVSSELFSILKEKERIELIELKKIIFEWMKKNTPLHISCLNCSPLSTIVNDTSMFLSYQDNCESCHEPEITCWSLITYRELEKEGFNLYFCRRTIGKYLSLGKLKQRSNHNGNYYIILRDRSFEKSIVNSNVFLELDQDGIAPSKSKGFILNHFTKKEVNSLFSKYKTYLFRSLKKEF